MKKLSRGNLLPGERLNLLTEELNTPQEFDEKAITAKYVGGDIRIVTEQGRTQLPELPLQLASGRYVLNPEYQRRRRWSATKQSRLIESFLMNVPIPPIFLYEYDYAHYEVMDGQQRLSALQAFYDDDLPLTGLEYWNELEGRTYSTLPTQLRQGIDRRYLSSIVLLYETARNADEAERLKQLVFERINTGGVRLSNQEQRNAVSRGVLNIPLAQLARTTSFCLAWGIPEPDENELSMGEVRLEVREDSRYQSMEDVEMVLRFFAHRQRTSVGPLRNMRTFLDSYWKIGNQNLPKALVDELGALFVKTSDLAFDVLGERAFYLRRDRQGGRSWVPRSTLVAYDAVMSAFSRHVDRGEILRERKSLVRSELEMLYDSSAQHFDGRRTDPQDVELRNNLISEILESVAVR